MDATELLLLPKQCFLEQGHVLEARCGWVQARGEDREAEIPWSPFAVPSASLSLPMRDMEWGTCLLETLWDRSWRIIPVNWVNISPSVSCVS